MTAFDRSKLNFDGLFLTNEDRFVARFKYKKRSATSLRSFLAKNFSVEEFFALRDADESPLHILETRGYLLPHVRRLLLELGLSPTPAGKQDYLRMQQLVRDVASRAVSPPLDVPVPRRD